MQMGMERAKAGNSVVNISPEDMEKHQKMLMSRMNEVEQMVREKPSMVFSGHVVANHSTSKPMTLVTHGT
jgi:hypothetical protein